MHIRNYGAVVCLSCRAFWRRAHQKTRHPAYECRKTGNCDLNVKNRRACQKCRYVRCRLAGMDADAVLTEQQRQFRFRKVIERKTLQRIRVNSENDPGNSSEDTDDARMRSPARHVRSNLFPPLPPPQHIPNRWTKMLQPKVEAIVRSYETSQDENCSNKMFDKLDSIFEGDVELKIDRKEIISDLNKMAEEFARFAELQR